MAVDRAAVFIDAGYLESVLDKEFPGMAVDFGKLGAELCVGKELLRAYYYNCPPFVSAAPTAAELERERKANRFYDVLRRLARFEVRLGRLAARSCSKCGHHYFQQKRADLLLGVDLVNLSAKGQISKAILISGDSDFVPAVLVAKENGVLVHLVHGGRLNPPHNDLFLACDERTALTKELIEKVRRK